MANTPWGQLGERIATDGPPLVNTRVSSLYFSPTS